MASDWERSRLEGGKNTVCFRYRPVNISVALLTCDDRFLAIHPFY